MQTIPRPPDDLMFVGNPQHFETVGEEFTGYLLDLCGLRPDHAVLDIGCGVGRIAAPLTGVLGGGRYEGFDVVASGVEWARREITSRFPAFRFTHADIHNSRYNAAGSIRAEEFRFPYPDRSFDVAFATSVFTHMLPSAVERYLGETRRVLRGTALLTWYLLDDVTDRCLAENSEGRPTFGYELGGCRVERIETPEDVVAFPLEMALSMLERAGFTVEAVHFGGWSGRTDRLSWQDILIVS